MCGIHVSVSRRGYIAPSDQVVERLRRRGPDSVRTEHVKLHVHSERLEKTPSNDSQDVYISMTSTVLSMRGESITTQPLTSTDSPQGKSTHCILCWNGEAWTLAGQVVTGNDAQMIHQALSHIASSFSLSKHVAPELAVAEVMSCFAGPYAFVFLDAASARLYFARDFLGRRSLLWRHEADGGVAICSVSDPSHDGWQEVEADGIHWIALDRLARDDQVHVHCTSYRSTKLDESESDTRCYLPHLTLNLQLPAPTEEAYAMSPASPAVIDLYRLLRRSSALRTDLASYIPRTLEQQKPRIAILFSGGLDCTVLARIIDDLLPHGQAIDLLNVAFENPRIHKTDSDQSNIVNPYETCPDRITGRKSLLELQMVCSNRDWRFVAIDIPYTETMSHRDTVISLIHPHDTEMDISIGNALYFAARGQGVISRTPSSTPELYTSTARILISGLGADELFGGYARHGTAFERRGYPGLLDELQLDVARLGKRNLGRDDRVLSHWGKETRFPFLDETVVQWALQTPVWQKCGFGRTEGVTADDSTIASLDPSKLVLRCLAAKLGMHKVANEKKRAVSTDL